MNEHGFVFCEDTGLTEDCSTTPLYRIPSPESHCNTSELT